MTEDMRSRLTGGEDVRNPPMDRGADRLRARFLDQGVAAFDFRASLIEWSPPETDFFGEVVFSHSLGRLPKGILLVDQSIPLRWSVPAAQKAKWNTTQIAVYVDAWHPFEQHRETFTNGTTSLVIDFAKRRSTEAMLQGFATAADNSATDRPPFKVRMESTAGEYDQVTIRYGDEASVAFSTVVNVDVTTSLYVQDEFVWQVI